MICASVVNLLAELQSALESRDFEEAREILFPTLSPFDWRDEGHENHNECTDVLLDAIDSLSALATKIGVELRWSWIRWQVFEGWGFSRADCLRLYARVSTQPDTSPCRGFDHETALKLVREGYGTH